MTTTTTSRILYTLLFVAVSAGLIAIYFSAYSSGPSVYLTPPDTAAPPLVVPIAAGTVSVPRGQHRDFPFRLPSHLCRITGQVASPASGGGEGAAEAFSALLFNDTTFANFQAGKSVTPSWDSGKVRESKLDIMVMGPGRFHLFVANESGPVHRAPVSVQAQATCSARI